MLGFELYFRSFFNLVLNFSYKFGPFAYNLYDTEKASQLAVDWPVHQLSILSWVFEIEIAKVLSQTKT
jgi:hypothetical protein